MSGREAWMRIELAMEDRSLFISSCSRRELARRRPTRNISWTPLMLTLIVLALAAGAIIAARGGV
jgi:lysylphosphatidylglycerol synthetase-like protein (DUF2156 family)